jgi:colanic acid biosynthesis glycosyl transferase WcaI
MKFLVLSQFFPPETGAPQTRLGEFTQNLVKLGHEVEVLTAMPNYPAGKISQNYQNKFYVKEDYKGIPTHRVWLYAAQGKSIQRLLCYLSFTVTALFGLFVCKKPDFIFINSGPLFLSLTGRIFSLFWNRPVIFNVADLWPRSVEQLNGTGGFGLLKKLALALESWSYKSAKFVTAVTEGIRTILLAEKNVPESKLLYLPNGVNTELYNPQNPNLKPDQLLKKLQLEDKFILIYSGNHGFAHALDNVLNAAKIVQNLVQQNESLKKIHFLFVGDGSDKKRLLKIKQDLQLSNVSFLDPVDQESLADYLKIAHVGLINVRNTHLANETRPAKMFPMMSMQKPILFAGFGEGAEIIKSCDGGLVIEPENSEALASATIEFFNNYEKFSKLGANNRNFVIQHLQFKSIVQSWLNELHKKSSPN